MNTENRIQWWADFKTRYASVTNAEFPGRAKEILVDTWISGKLPGVVDYINVSDLEPHIAVDRVIRYLLRS